MFHRELELFARLKGHALAQKNVMAPPDDHDVFAGLPLDRDGIASSGETVILSPSTSSTAFSGRYSNTITPSAVFTLTTTAQATRNAGQQPPDGH